MSKVVPEVYFCPSINLHSKFMPAFLLDQLATFATLATAVVAYLIYRKSKQDELQSGVRIIILEIKESERIIRNWLETKNAGQSYADDLLKVTPLKGWTRYSHLFVHQLNNDEYDLLNDYFKKCEVLEKYIEKNHNFFWITTEERARQKEMLGAKLAQSKPDLTPEVFSQEVEQLADLYFNTMRYTPAGIKTQIDRILNSVTLISTTPLWNKLKRLAEYNDRMG